MKIFNIIGSVLGLLFLGSNLALAEIVKFGPSDIEYGLTPPANWEKHDTTHGVQLVSQDKNTSLAVFLLKKEDITAEDLQQLQQILPSKLGLTDVKKQEHPKNVVITGVLEERELEIQQHDFEDCIVYIIAGGTDHAAIKNCIASLHRIAVKPKAADKKGK
ncbi:MAG: hypothetical protein IJU79_03590 [Desulfovibrionaceae bacterium]|nr:hypothetical protein [Desulfovibrionaceae bacterium]